MKTIYVVIDTLEKILQDESHADFKSVAKASGLVEYFLFRRFTFIVYI